MSTILGKGYNSDKKDKNFIDIYTEKKLSLDSIIYIDIPVFLGVLFVFILTLKFESDNYLRGYTTFGSDKFLKELLFQIQNHDSFKTFSEAKTNLFVNGFSAGVIAIQIIFSQFFFAVLRSKQIYTKFMHVAENE